MIRVPGFDRRVSERQPAHTGEEKSLRRVSPFHIFRLSRARPFSGNSKPSQQRPENVRKPTVSNCPSVLGMFLGLVLLFDPRREHSFVPIGNLSAAATQGLSRLAASLPPPARLGLEARARRHAWLAWIEGPTQVGNFNPLLFDLFHAAADTPHERL